MPENASVLILDDDPIQLRIYRWIAEAAGYCVLTALVGLDSVTLPEDSADLVLLGDKFAGALTAVKMAELVRSRYPLAPILVLSEAFSMPDDIAPYVQGFVRKGDPAKLVERLREMLGPCS